MKEARPKKEYKLYILEKEREFKDRQNWSMVKNFKNVSL